MTFRCLFIIRIYDVDTTDLQPFCYKPFDNINKILSNECPDSLPLKNFSDWYQDVLKSASDLNYTTFDESSIRDYLCNPIYKIKTNSDVLEPCILINKNNFLFGGLLFVSNRMGKMNLKYEFGSSVDFICGMSTHFINILKKNPKYKMIDLMPDFYYFIKIMCPYGTPITSNANLVEYFKNSENILKSLTVLSPEKTVLSINQIPVNLVVKTRELKIVMKEVVIGVQHESKSGQAKFDIDIIGEVSLYTSNLDINGEISFTLKSHLSHLISKSVFTDILLHPSCTSCSYQSPVSISLQNQKPLNDALDKGADDSPNSPNFLFNENSLVQSVSKRYTGIDSNILSRHLQSISRSSSVYSINDGNKLSSSISITVKPWSDFYTLLTYKIMQLPADTDADFENISLPFVLSCKSPEPPIICSYQLEDMSVSPEFISNIILRIKLNPRMFQTGDKMKSVEFTKLDVLFPFFNRHPLSDVSKCTVSQGKLFILEQNRHIMLWSLGSILKKNEASLIGSIKFQPDASQAPYVDKFCVQSNAYCQIKFSLKNSNLSGLSVDTRNVMFSIDRGVKVTQKQECVSYNFKIWNSMGVCPIEFLN